MLSNYAFLHFQASKSLLAWQFYLDANDWQPIRN